MARTPEVRPETCTGTRLSMVELFPSAPPLEPQHLTPPFTSAHVWNVPAAMAWTPEVRPETCTGTRLSVVELFPSSPAELEPQHWTPPFTSAHVWYPPETITP